MSTPLRPAYSDPKGTIIYNFASLPLFVYRDTTPAGATPTQVGVAGYSKGCIWVNSTGTAGTVVCVNTGTTAISAWTFIV